MLKIKKFKVENFRGIRLPLEIDFVKNNAPTSALVYGRNGTGKSSLLDAWEWLLTFSIVHLGREGVSANDFPHKASGGVNSAATVACEHPDIEEVTVSFNTGRITQPDTVGRYSDLKAHCVYPNYLRYSDLQDFVFKTKTEKYKYLAKFFGLEKFSENQDSIKAVVGRLSAKLGAINNEIAVQQEQLTETLGGKPNKYVLVEFLNGLAEKHGLPQIATLEKLADLKNSFGEIVASDPKTLELTQWKTLKTFLEGFYPLPELTAECSDLDDAFVALKGDANAIRQIYVAKLLETAISTIPQLGTDPSCPVCDHEFEGNLLEHVEIKHEAIKKVVEKKLVFDKKKAAVKEALNDILQKANRLHLNGLPAGARDQPEIEAIQVLQTELVDVINTLRSDFTDIKSLELSSSPCIRSIETLKNNQAGIGALVDGQAQALESDASRKSLADDYGQLVITTDLYGRLVAAAGKQKYLSGNLTKLEKLLEHLTSYIQEQIQTTFADISQEVMDCFNALEGSDTIFRNPQVVLVQGRDRAVELDIEFANESVRPAFKFLSESQINSFGLAIFLAAVKHFNQEFKFFILDDVVNSFDAYKRPRIPALFAARFADFQILMLTHDQIFFDTVQRAFPNWNRYRFTGWDYTNGPMARMARNYSEEIQHLLDDDSPILAGQALGRYLEWVFGSLCESIEALLKYKLLNVYTLGEFYDPLAKRFRDKLKKPGYTHKLLLALDQFEAGTIFRNYCAHWKNEAAPFTSDEIKGVFDKWKEIEALVWCEDCKGFLGFEKSGNNEHMRCSCSVLNLKDDKWYQAVVESA